MAEENLDQKLLLYVVPYTLKDEDKIHYGAVAAYGKNMAGIAVEKLLRESGKNISSILIDETTCIQQITDIARKVYNLKLEPIIRKKKRCLLARIFRRD